jgi:hypothetical protein
MMVCLKGKKYGPIVIFDPQEAPSWGLYFLGRILEAI